MKKNEIIAKLKEVLPENNKSGIHSEKINEILMLIRHLVESDKRYDFSIIKFYCDWILHPKKDFIPAKMKSLLQEVLKNEDSFVQRFLEAIDLHSELKKFFDVGDIIWVKGPIF